MCGAPHLSKRRVDQVDQFPICRKGEPLAVAMENNAEEFDNGPRSSDIGQTKMALQSFVHSERNKFTILDIFLKCRGLPDNNLAITIFGLCAEINSSRARSTYCCVRRPCSAVARHSVQVKYPINCRERSERDRNSIKNFFDRQEDSCSSLVARIQLGPASRPIRRWRLRRRPA
jgi:hypothetical protein